MAAVYPGAYNTFVRSHEASHKLVVDFARNIKKFPVNRYAQTVPVPKLAGYFLNMTVEEAGRILATDGAQFVWYDGQPAPEGNEGTESHEYKAFKCRRYCYPVILGDLTIDQADWNILAQHSSIKARQAMTMRTQLAVTQLTTTGNYATDHRIDVTTLTGNTGNWVQSTAARQDIKRSLHEAALRIMKDTLSGIDKDDLILVIGAELAAELTETQEIVDYIKSSPVALAQIRGELPGSNTHFGLPDKLYGYPLVVEDTVKVTTRKGATTSRSFIMPKATPVMVARPGGLVGVADAPNFSTLVIFEQEAMSSELKRDDDNRRTKARVVDCVGVYLIAQASGVYFSAVA